tara:strand:+ start:1835 stop:2431 length:597 start_codon:yes stop_codon:yes gene_type:complete
MEEKTFKIDNFIAIYDNYITKEECENAIKLFENENKLKQTYDRELTESTNNLAKKDNQFFCESKNVDVWWEELKPMMFNFDIAWKHYIQHTAAEVAYGDIPFHYTSMKIQKTLPGEGYHIWHVEHGRGFVIEPRAFVFSIYLNDVESGGETEFLNQSVRVKPKTGRIVIWPAGFPYVHRGNPPLKDKKYIITSWMLVR